MNLRLLWRIPLGCAATLAFAAPLARAADPERGVQLTWNAPRECLDQASAKRAIESYLGDRTLDVFKALAVRVDISSAADGRFRAELTVGGPSGGNRRFEGTNCARVSEAAALIVALMLDPVEVATQIDPRRQPPVEPREANATSAARAAAGGNSAPSEAPKQGSLRVAIGLQTTGDVGSLPEPTVGAGFFAGIDGPRAALIADVATWVPRRVLRGPTAASGGEIRLSTASLRGCLAPTASSVAGVRLDICLRAEAGVAGGRGVGIAESRSPDALWAAGFAGVTVRSWNPTALGVWLSVEGGAALSRPRFTMEDFGLVFQASPVVGRALLGVGWTLP